MIFLKYIKYIYICILRFLFVEVSLRFVSLFVTCHMSHRVILKIDGTWTYRKNPLCDLGDVLY